MVTRLRIELLRKHHFDRIFEDHGAAKGIEVEKGGNRHHANSV